MYRRIAFAAAILSLAVGGMLMVWVVLRPHADDQRLYGTAPEGEVGQWRWHRRAC